MAFSNCGWTKVVGHSIYVDDLHFSAVPIKNIIRVSEVESGAKLFDTPVPDTFETFEETMFFLEVIVFSQIAMMIQKAGIKKVKEAICLMKETTFNKFGQKPEGQKVNTEWIKEGIGDALH